MLPPLCIYVEMEYERKYSSIWSFTIAIFLLFSLCILIFHSFHCVHTPIKHHLKGWRGGVFKNKQATFWKLIDESNGIIFYLF